MNGKSLRQEARERLARKSEALLEKYIPANESVAVKDGEFWEWEEMADAYDREMTAAILEELVGLSASATLAEPGCCPHSGSGNTKWLQEQGQRERRSKHGLVVLLWQVARCRSCGRSFSPSGATMASVPAGPSDPAGGGAGESGRGPTAFDVAARDLNADWGTTFDGKQMQRWAVYFGGKVAASQERERRGYIKGRDPRGRRIRPCCWRWGWTADGSRSVRKTRRRRAGGMRTRC